MAMQVDRSFLGREKRQPDIFLSHSSRDKAFVRKLAEDLSFMQVDAWLDEWEIHPGDSLHDVVSTFLKRSRYVAVILGENYHDSRWAKEELKKALADERHGNEVRVLPVLVASVEVPSFLEDRLYVDMRGNYYQGLCRLAGLVHKVSTQRMGVALSQSPPCSIGQAIEAMRYCGVDPFVILDKDDCREILDAGGHGSGGVVHFDPKMILSSGNITPRVANLMRRLVSEVWKIDYRPLPMRRVVIKETVAQNVKGIRGELDAHNLMNHNGLDEELLQKLTDFLKADSNGEEKK